MYKKRLRYVFIIGLQFLLLLTACNSIAKMQDRNSISAEELVGIWLQDDFNARLNDVDRHVGTATVIYITHDGNLFIHRTSVGSTAGLITFVMHFTYVVEHNQLKIIPYAIPLYRSWYHLTVECFKPFESHSLMEGVEISVRNNRMRLYLPDRETVILYHKTDEIPYGWTNSDRQEIVEQNRGIQNELHALATRFGEALNLPIEPYEGTTFISYGEHIYQHIVPFNIEDILFEIAFTGTTPTPMRPQSRHVFPGGYLIGLPDSIANINNNFSLIYWRFEIPEEWLYIFAALE